MNSTDSQIPVSSIVTSKTLEEFLLLKFSFEQYHNTHWYVSTDSSTTKALQNYKNITPLELIDSDEGSHGSNDPKKNEIFHKLIMTKFDALEAAIENHGYGLFIDADIFFTNPLEEKFITLMKNEDVDAILSPHMTNNANVESEVGYYNVGFYSMRNKKYLKMHREMSLKYRELDMYYEQQPLQFCSYNFTTINAPIYYNIGWWRFSGKNNQSRMNLLKIKNNTIFFEDNPAVCFHAHTLRHLDYENFGSTLVERTFTLMKECQNEKYKELILFFNSLNSSNMT